MIKKIAQYEPDPADDPSFRIERIALKETVILEGHRMTMLTPLEDWENFMDFDRNAVKLGYKEFVRPVMKSDAPKQVSATHVIVSGDERMRVRTFATI